MLTVKTSMIVDGIYGSIHPMDLASSAGTYTNFSISYPFTATIEFYHDGSFASRSDAFADIRTKLGKFHADKIRQQISLPPRLEIVESGQDVQIVSDKGTSISLAYLRFTIVYQEDSPVWPPKG